MRRWRAAWSSASAAPTTSAPTESTTSSGSPVTSAAPRSPGSTSRSTRSTTARSVRRAGGSSRTGGCRSSCGREAHAESLRVELYGRAAGRQDTDSDGRCEVTELLPRSDGAGVLQDRGDCDLRAVDCQRDMLEAAVTAGRLSDRAERERRPVGIGLDLVPPAPYSHTAPPP